MAELKHAWYSRDARMAHGSCKWARASGEIIEVTFVDDDPDAAAKHYKWEDWVYCGTVSHCVEHNHRAEQESERLMQPGGVRTALARVMQRIAEKEGRDDLRAAFGDYPPTEDSAR